MDWLKSPGAFGEPVQGVSLDVKRIGHRPVQHRGVEHLGWGVEASASDFEQSSSGGGAMAACAKGLNLHWGGR